MMNFDDLSSKAGLENLNDFLQDKSYIEGYAPSQNDAAVYKCIGKSFTEYPHVARWYKHISSFKESFNQLPGKDKLKLRSQCIIPSG